MCKFHKDVARAIATNPVTNEFDAGQYCVALLAMAAFRIEQYMPPMHGCDGFVPAEMTTDAAVKAFADSGLARPQEKIDAFATAQLPALRAAMATTATRYELTLAALNVPDNITRDGYKHCAKMAADPTKNGPFMDEAVVQLFAGYDDDAKTWARGDLDFLRVAHKPEFENIRAAAADFMAQDGIRATMKTMFEHSVARIFMAAQDDLAAGRGYTKTDGCVMCGHGDRADVNPGNKPAKSTSLHDFARAARDGIGGAALSHVGCIVTPFVAGAFGLAVSGPFMAGMMLVTAPAIAMGATWGLNRLRGHGTTPKSLAISATVAVGMALAISHMTGGHDHHHGGHHDHHHSRHHSGMGVGDICTAAPRIAA